MLGARLAAHLRVTDTTHQALDFMPPRIAKLAAFGAFGAVAFFLAIYVLIVVAAAPRHTGGIDWIQAIVTWISVGVAVLAIVALHIVFARGLFDIARGGRRSL